MKDITAYLAGAALIASSIVISCTKNTESDDELVGNWKRTDDFEGNARSEAAGFTIGEYAYITTGSTTSERFRDLWEYNVARRYWVQKADLPGAARNSAVAFSIGTKGYMGTGYDGAVRLRDFWEYDQALNQWTRKADFAGSGRYDAVAFAMDGKGFISCGYDGNYLKDLWQYDPSTDQWLQKASVGGSKRAAAFCFVINDKAYIGAGNNNGEVQKDLWVYDLANNEWTEKNKLYDYLDDSFDDDYASIPRHNGVTFQVGANTYLACGENSSLVTATWQYDAATDRWHQKTDFEGTARTGAIGFTLNNRGFAITGRSGTLMMDNGYEFLPEAEQVDND